MNKLQWIGWKLWNHGITSPNWMRGWFNLRRRDTGESKWHASWENAFGLWSLYIYTPLLVLEVIGPFGLRRK